jgi:hypothetical protein
MMKVELKICFLEDEPDHPVPYLETYVWEDGTCTELPACCIYGEIGVNDFPITIKKLIEVKLTNNLSQMVSGIYSSELMELASDLFFISFYDIDEAPTDCYFIKGTVEEALNEYLGYTKYLEIPFMNIFYALEKKVFGKNGLKYVWTPASTFSKNPDLEGLQIKVKTNISNTRLQEIISSVELDRKKADSWAKGSGETTI